MRMTLREGGGWSLRGLDWKQVISQPPQIYGALCKLKDMEDLIDEINDPARGQNGDGELALRELLGKGTDGIHIREGSYRKWLMKRFCETE